MDREDDANILAVRDPYHRTSNSREPAVEAFTAMTGHQDKSFSLGESAIEDLLCPRPQLGALVEHGGDPQQGVDTGIAGY
jgi:hypothetical protein